MTIYFFISLVGAILLFLVQPMVAKTALPILGGAGFVWNGCMVFFQALLLAGYLYAHLLNRQLPVRRQPLIHIPLLMLALLAFPLSFAGSAYIDPSQQPIYWLLAMLTLSVGAPFFVLSATSPLSQRWFSASNHASAHNPYVLYSASNIGSFVGLFAYPFLIEPNFSIGQQANILRYGYMLLVALFTVAAFSHVRNPSPVASVIPSNTGTAPSYKQILQWLGLAFIPASLLYGVTTYVITDIASVPLFWLIPLGLYLLSFILVFGHRPPSLAIYRTLALMGAPAMAYFALLPIPHIMTMGMLHLAIFFSIAMVCHGRLAQIKPRPEQLTVFFLWISFGGVLGGIFNTFVAPALFNSIIEYPVMLLASLIVAGPWIRPTLGQVAKTAIVWSVFSLVFWLLGNHIGIFHSLIPDEKAVHTWLQGVFAVAGLVLLIVGYFLYKEQTLHYAFWIAPIFLVITPLYIKMSGVSEAFIDRNMYGVSRIFWREQDNAWEFRHGTTVHGIQSADNAHRLEPTSYYGEPLKEMYKLLPKSLTQTPVAVLGMGIGTVACYGHAGQDYDFFEIDPLVDIIAHDTRYFTYLRDCPPNKHVIMGDGRINLNRAANNRYGVIIVDVFTSDAIPMHLMTREAIAMYAQKLMPGGVIAINISNRHIDLVPVLAAVAKDTGLSGAWIFDVPPANATLAFPSRWVVLSKNKALLNALQTGNKYWRPLPAADQRFLWQDSYSNIFRSIHFN